MDDLSDLKDEFPSAWPLHHEAIGAAFKTLSLNNIPTGSLIVSHGAHPFVMYHSNDLHTHVNILIWSMYDGSDRLTMNYEPGVSRALFLDLFPNANGLSCNLVLLGLGEIIRNQEFAHRPLPEVLAHPRYLEVMSRLVKLLPLVLMTNNCKYSCKHKYLPIVFPEAMSVGFANPREYYWELAGSNQPMAIAFRETRHVSVACSDASMLFISLLHEELFIRDIPPELTPDKILASQDDYDIARLLGDNSDLFQMYERESMPIYKTIFTSPCSMHQCFLFFFPYVFAFIACLALFLIVPRLVKLVFSTPSLRPDNLLGSIRRYG